jgi:AcrR family transcriptional regulator
LPGKAKGTTSRRPDRWVGLSPADRRAGRRALLLDTAFDLLGTEGYSATTVRAVCQRASLNPRYFYENFADLDALLLAVYDRVVTELAESVVKAVAAAHEPMETTRAAISATVQFVDEDRRRGRVMYAEALGNEALNRRRLESSTALVEAIGADSSARYPEPDAVQQINRVAAAMVVGGFTELLIAWLDGRIDLETETLIDHTTTLCVAIGTAAIGLTAR